MSTFIPPIYLHSHDLRISLNCLTIYVFLSCVNLFFLVFSFILNIVMLKSGYIYSYWNNKHDLTLRIQVAVLISTFCLVKFSTCIVVYVNCVLYCKSSID